MTDVEKEVGEKIWKIAQISPEHGNAVMDLVGLPAYNRIANMCGGGKTREKA